MRVVNIKMLPDGSGRVRMHWFERTPDGPVQTLSGVVMSDRGPMTSGGVRGRIACQPQVNNVSPRTQAGETHLTLYSDDPRAATCPECLATEAYKRWMEEAAQNMTVAV